MSEIRDLYASDPATVRVELLAKEDMTPREARVRLAVFLGIDEADICEVVANADRGVFVAATDKAALRAVEALGRDGFHDGFAVRSVAVGAVRPGSGSCDTDHEESGADERSPEALAERLGCGSAHGDGVLLTAEEAEDIAERLAQRNCGTCGHSWYGNGSVREATCPSCGDQNAWSLSAP